MAASLQLVAACAAGFTCALLLHGCGGSGNACATDGSHYHYAEVVDGATRKITTSFCPNHPYVSGLNPNEAIILDVTSENAAYQVPSMPMLEPTAITDLSEIGSLTGIFFSGTMLTSPYGGPSYGKVTNMATSAITVEGDTFDMCNTHAYSSSDPAQHAHMAPACLLNQLNDTADKMSPQIAWAADGFPVYGPRGPAGKVMVSCKSDGATAPCADDCGGLEGDYGDGYLYRYFTLGPTHDGTTCKYPASENTPWPIEEKYYPNVPVCFRGCCPEGAQCTGKDAAFAVQAPSGWLATCSAEAQAGTTTGHTATAKYPTGLGKYETTCWDSMTSSAGNHSFSRSALVGGAVGVAVLSMFAMAMLLVHRSRANPHQRMPEVEMSTPGAGDTEAAQAASETGNSASATI